MMRYLTANCDALFLQVLACDRDFDLFSRVWCIAEVVEAARANIEQHVIIHSKMNMNKHYTMLSKLKVEDCDATREEDKQSILAKITDKEEFNTYLQDTVLFSSTGIFGPSSQQNRSTDSAAGERR